MKGNLVNNTPQYQESTSLLIASSACIVACGQKRFLSPKSNLSFPAFLIRFQYKEEENGKRYYYQWRSKRDFLNLKRRQSSSSAQEERKNKVNFPKSSFAKLTDDATSNEPWVVPLTGDLLRDRDIICKQLGNTSWFQNHENFSIWNGNYRPHMKKSIKRLEDFMNDCASMCESWFEFSRKEDSKGIISFDCQQTSQDSQNKISSAARLGQYYTNEPNCKKIVQEAVAFYHKIQQDRNGFVVFVEPSCGDGRIVLQLFKSLQSISACNFLILAYDVDEGAVVDCRENVSKLPILDEGQIVVSCCDFLKLSRHDLTNTIHEHFNEDSRLIVLGNPPYSSGVGSGKDIQRDLPKKFIIHGIRVGAEFISFLVPKRYNNEIGSMIRLIVEECNESWTCESHNLDDSQFEFGTNLFCQPSLLQCWYRGTNRK